MIATDSIEQLRLAIMPAFPGMGFGVGPDFGDRERKRIEIFWPRGMKVNLKKYLPAVYELVETRSTPQHDSWIVRLKQLQETKL